MFDEAYRNDVNIWQLFPRKIQKKILRQMLMGSFIHHKSANITTRHT